MNEIVLKPATPKQAANLVSVLLKNGFNPRDAIVQYSLREYPSVKLSNVKDFPLILTGTMDGYPMRVSVSQIVVGRYCEGTYALVKILKEIGFHFDERDFYTVKRFDKDTGHFSMHFSKR